MSGSHYFEVLSVQAADRPSFMPKLSHNVLLMRFEVAAFTIDPGVSMERDATFGIVEFRERNFFAE
jgi:hypothetical protein